MITFDNEGGAQRSDMKLRYDLITTELQKRLARTMTLGALQYGEFNWQNGGVEFAKDAFNHAQEHLLHFKDGDMSEDHLAHAAANIMFLMYYENGFAKEKCIANEIQTFDDYLKMKENPTVIAPAAAADLPVVAPEAENSVSAGVGAKLGELFGWGKLTGSKK